MSLPAVSMHEGNEELKIWFVARYIRYSFTKLGKKSLNCHLYTCRAKLLNYIAYAQQMLNICYCS